MNKSLLLLFPVFGFALSSCGQVRHCEPIEYFYKQNQEIVGIPWGNNDDFKVLIVTDVHLSQSDDLKRHFDFMQLTLNQSQANFLVLNGDIFTYADKSIVNRVFTFINDWCVKNNAYWAYTFGNHDDQGYYNDHYIQSVATQYSKSCFVDLDDDISGRSNYVINLYDEQNNNKVVHQLFILDSHSYRFIPYWGYDYIGADQVKWYEDIVNFSKTQYGNGEVIKNSMFFHINLPEHEIAWQALEEKRAGKTESDNPVIKDIVDFDAGSKGGNTEFAGHPFDSPNPSIFDKITDLKATKNVTAGHNHSNDGAVQYKDVRLFYGIHSTDRIYYDDSKLGGLVLSIDKETGYANAIRYYHSYSEIK